MYHDVVVSDPDESGFPGRGPATYKVDWPTFESHLDAFDHVGASPRTARLTEMVPTLTFDDGGSCMPVVAEALAARGWVGVFLVPTALLGTPGFAHEDDLRRAHALGHVIGSHSQTHPTRISELSSREIANEWSTSLETLQTILRARVTVGSVPGGFTSREVERAAAACGITTLYVSRPTTRTRRQGDCAIVGRFAVRCATHADRALAYALGTGTARSGQALAWGARAIPKRLLGDVYPRARSFVKRRARR